MKFYEDMPDVEAKDDLLVMVGDTTSPNQPKKITFAKIKAFVKQNWTINFGDLGKKPKINGVELKEADNTLAELKLQPAGSYIDAKALSDAVATTVLKDTKELPIIANEYTNVVLYARNEGEDFSRPHYHALLFNCFFSDRKKHSTGDSGSVIYTSEALTKLWPFGFASIGDVTFESAAYCSRYIMKKVTGDLAESHYETVDLSTGEVSARVPEFNRMSLKPGIGAEWIKRYNKDVYPRDVVIARGHESKPPRYYDKFLQSFDADKLEDVKFSRTPYLSAI